MTMDCTFTVDRNPAEDHIVSFVAQIHEKRVGTLSRIDGAIEVLKSAEKASGIAPVCDIFVAVGHLLEKVKHMTTQQLRHAEIALDCADVCKALDRRTSGMRPEDLNRFVLEAMSQLDVIVMNVRRAVDRLAERELLPRWTTFEQDEERTVAWRLILYRILLILNPDLSNDPSDIYAVARRYRPITHEQATVAITDPKQEALPSWIKDIPYLSADVEVWSEGGETQVQERVNEIKHPEGDQSPQGPGFPHSSPGRATESPPNNTRPYCPNELVGELVAAAIPDSAAERNGPRSRSGSRKPEDLDDELLGIPVPFPPPVEANDKPLQNEDTTPSRLSPSPTNQKSILFDPMSPLFRSNSTSSGAQRAMIMARLIGESFDPAAVITGPSFGKLARNHTVAGGNRAAARTLMFDGSDERQNTDVRETSPSPKRGGASIEGDAAVKIERKVPHSPPPPLPVVALGQFEPGRRNYDTPQFHPPGAAIAPPLECVPMDDRRYSESEGVAEVITEATSRRNEEPYQDGIKSGLSRSAPVKSTRSRRTDGTPGRPRNNSDSNAHRESDADLPSDETCEGGVFAFRSGQPVLQTSNSSPPSPTPLPPSSIEGSTSDPARCTDSKLFPFPSMVESEWNAILNPTASSGASLGMDTTNRTNVPVITFTKDSDSPTRPDTLATDHLSECLGEQLQSGVQTRNVYHSSLPSHSRDSTCPSDDDLPLTIHPVPDLSNLVSLGTPACTRLISRSFSPQQIISLIEAIFTSKDEVAMVRDLRGDDVQTFVDVVNEALDLPDLQPLLRGKCIRMLYRVCGRHALLPRSLRIPPCHNRLDTPLYRGGFADVWKGEHQGRNVAVKVLRVYSTNDVVKIRSRFCREVVTWGALRHPNVLSLLGIVMGDDQLAMVSEWMANGNINEFVKVHKDKNRFELLKDVARGLMYMHDQEMIHGDLKGANILVDEDCNARLADFGLLTIVSDPTIFTTSSSIIACGTTRWMSPELLHPSQFGLKDHRPTKESDFYALGMVIYEVLSGKVPFATSVDVIVMRKVVEGDHPERPEGVRGLWFTDDLWGILNRCWATQPKSRPSIVVVSECLERASTTWEPPSHQADEDPEKDDEDWDLTEIVFAVWSVVSIPFTPGFHGGFRANYAPVPL